MANAPWNMTHIRKWMIFDSADLSTFPNADKRIIAIDSVGNMAICSFDRFTLDFIVVTDGMSKEEIKSASLDIINNIVKRYLKRKKDKSFIYEDDIYEDLLESSCDSFAGKTEAVYFSDVVAWMDVPPLSKDIELQNLYGEDEETFSDEVQIRVFDIMAAIEPAIRHAINKAVNTNAT